MSKLQQILLYLILGLIIVPGNRADVAIPSDLEIKIHEFVNEERESLDFKALKLHSELIEIAREHSNDMLINNFFEHKNLNGEEPADRVDNHNIRYSAVAENLYHSTGVFKSDIAYSAFKGWKDSSGHYINMLSETSYTGIGIAVQDTTYYITQVFIEASESHMKEKGAIFDNDNLPHVDAEDSSGGINQTFIIIGIVVIIIVIGKDAERRNRRYRRR